jgi:hypothetical protein
MARPGVRPPTPLPRDLELVVEDADPARRLARVSVKDDRLSALLPGAVLVAPNLAGPIVVGEVAFRGTADAIWAEVLGVGGMVEMLAALVLAIVPPAPLAGEYRYQVADADMGAPNLTALVHGCPPALSCAKVYGLPGVTAALSPGSVVLVSFQDGNPARPCVSGYVSGTPISASLSASSALDLEAPAIKLGGVQPVVLDNGGGLTTYLTAIGTALTALGHPIGSVPIIQSTKVTAA